MVKFDQTSNHTKKKKLLPQERHIQWPFQILLNFIFFNRCNKFEVDKYKTLAYGPKLHRPALHCTTRHYWTKLHPNSLHCTDIGRPNTRIFLDLGKNYICEGLDYHFLENLHAQKPNSIALLCTTQHYITLHFTAININTLNNML